MTKALVSKRPGSTAEMRQFLLDQMVGVAKGDVDIGKAKVIGNLAQQVYNTVKLEMSFALMRKAGGVPDLKPVDWEDTSSGSTTKRLHSV